MLAIRCCARLTSSGRAAKYDNQLWQTALICQKVFVQVKKGAMQYMDDEVARLQNDTQLRETDQEEWAEQSDTVRQLRHRFCGGGWW